MNFDIVVPAQKPRNKEELQRALDEMEKALKGLREQLKKEDVPRKEKAREGSQREQSQLEKADKQLKDLTEKLQKSESDLLMWEERANWSQRMSQPGRQYITVSQAESDEARHKTAELLLRSTQDSHRRALFDAAEAALKTLREARDPGTQRKAADALDKALKQLREQGVQKEKPDSGKR